MLSSFAESSMFLRGSGGKGAGELGISLIGVPYLEVRRDTEWYGVPTGEGSGWLVMKASFSEK
jgi:hypothetical protein